MAGGALQVIDMATGMAIGGGITMDIAGGIMLVEELDTVQDTELEVEIAVIYIVTAPQECDPRVIQGIQLQGRIKQEPNPAHQVNLTICMRIGMEMYLAIRMALPSKDPMVNGRIPARTGLEVIYSRVREVITAIIIITEAEVAADHLLDQEVVVPVVVAVVDNKLVWNLTRT